MGTDNALSLQEARTTFELAAPIYHTLGNAEMGPPRHTEQRAACHPGWERTSPTQGPVLHSSALLET